MAYPEKRPARDGIGFELIPDPNLVIGKYTCPGDGNPKLAHTLSHGAQKGAVPSKIDCFAHPGVSATLYKTEANGTGGVMVS